MRIFLSCIPTYNKITNFQDNALEQPNALWEELGFLEQLVSIKNVLSLFRSA